MRATVLILAALVASTGCLTAGDVDASPRTAVATTDGVRLEAVADRGALRTDAPVTVTFSAENRREAAVWYAEGCGHTWGLRLLGPHGGEVQPQRPPVRCQGYSAARLDAGAAVAGGYGWDGRVWNGEERVPAPEGDYTVEVTFAFHPDETAAHAGEPAARVTARVPLTLVR